jgi:hypothetical protein
MITTQIALRLNQFADAMRLTQSAKWAWDRTSVDRRGQFLLDLLAPANELGGWFGRRFYDLINALEMEYPDAAEVAKWAQSSFDELPIALHLWLKFAYGMESGRFSTVTMLEQMVEAGYSPAWISQGSSTVN